MLEEVAARSAMPRGLITTRGFPLRLPPLSSYGRPIVAERNSAVEELFARAECSGYKKGAHREEDSTRNNRKHNVKTKKNQNSVLDRYIL
jgi:hypothetical protein